MSDSSACAPRAGRRWRRLAIATALGAVLSAVPGATATQAHESRPWCLPPVFEGGERLHGLPGPSVFWLELLLRQHEVCRRDEPGEVRIFLNGASAVFGFPLPAEQTFAHRLNQSFAATGVPAHVFNLAFVNPYQVRDAVIISEARRFAPDIILYPVTRSEFVHTAPIFFAPVAKFFDINRRAVEGLAAEPPAGLDEPFRVYATLLQRAKHDYPPLEYLRESGRLLRTGARLHARSVAAAMGGTLPPLAKATRRPMGGYDCGKTRDAAEKHYSDWQDWNILSYLDELRRRDGIEVVLVYWPVSHEPVEDCYNIRDTAAGVEEFAAWMRAETTARHIPYVDLHAVLAPELFLDSIHVSAEGHARVAELLAHALQPIVMQRLEHCRATGTGCGL